MEIQDDNNWPALSPGLWGSGGPSFKEGPVTRVNCIVRFLIEVRRATKWGNVHTMT